MMTKIRKAGLWIALLALTVAACVGVGIVAGGLMGPQLTLEARAEWGDRW